MHDHDPPDNTERLVALLGIGARTGRRDPPPPSDEQLAAFIDGRLRGSEREAMLAYLNRHPDYRHRWLEAAAQLAEPAPAERGPGPGVLDRLRLWLGAPRLWAAAALPAAAAALALLLWPAADLEQRLDAVYAAAPAAMELRPLPWEGTALGFAPAAPAPPARAFGAGLWDGRLALGAAGGDRPGFLEPPAGRSWTASPWRHHYLLGRWLLLLRAAAGTDAPIAEIREHRAILADLRHRLQQADTPEARQALAALAPLEPLLAAPDNPVLARRLDWIIGQLAP